MNCIRLKSLVNAASNEPRVGIQGASPTKWQVILSDEINIAIFRDNFFPFRVFHKHSALQDVFAPKTCCLPNKLDIIENFIESRI